ncbi:MAG: response regulator transcription factor [Deltaproteobacteria bacterium]|nr:response regulator transcription factor [Deltaproteobacteria bacterium]
MAQKARILIVEDDETIGAGLVTALEHENYNAVLVDNAEDGVTQMLAEPASLVISDIMLPGMSGLEMMQQIKRTHPQVPVIMLTARTDEIDRVMGLEMGADDYVTKPFSVREVVARVKARLRDHNIDVSTPKFYTFGDVEVDLSRRTLVKAGDASRLTTHEAGTLAYLIAHRGQDVSRDELLENVWGYTVSYSTRTVDNQILKLRKKIEDTPAEPRHILTVHGTGYRFEP